MKHLGDPAVREEIAQRIANVLPDSGAAWGRMTAPQMLCHLTDSYRVGMGEKSASPASGFLPQSFLKWMALRFPAPWPRGVATRPEVEQGPGGGGTPPGDFERDRAELLAVVRNFSNPERTFSWHPHPAFGPLTEWEWMRWGYLHADHHLRQFGV